MRTDDGKSQCTRSSAFDIYTLSWHHFVKFLTLDEPVASRAVTVIISGSKERTGEQTETFFFEPAK